MTFPRTSAEATWHRHEDAHWGEPVPWATRVLDLRPAGADAVPEWFTPDTRMAHEYVTADDLTARVEFVIPGKGPTLTGDDVEGPSTYVLTLTRHPDLPQPADDAIAVLFFGRTENDALLTLQEHGLWVGSQYSPNRLHVDAHMTAVHAGLLDPDGWAPGLSSATLSDPEPGAALFDLLHLSHPRFPTQESVRRLSILHQVVRDTILLAWADSDYTLTQIDDLATVFAPDEVADWLDHLDSAQAASFLNWAQRVPDSRVPGLGALAAAGWQAPTVNTLYPLLIDPDDVPPSNETLARVAALDIEPLRVVAALRAGLSLSEIEALGPEGVAALDPASLHVMAALRG